MDAHPLNLFQRLTRRWEAVHPYNAAQVLRIRDRIDPAAAGDAWAESLRALGLGRVRLFEQARFEHEVLNGEMADYPACALPAGSSLEEHLGRELNRPFHDPDEPPFRPFLLPVGNDFYFGVVYQHWIADSVSIRLVLREWFAQLYDPSMRRGSPARQAEEGYWRLFGARAGWRLDETILSAFRSHMRHRRVRKVRSAGREDYPVQVLLREATAGLIDPLKEYAAGEGVRLHDVLLAALAEACDRFVPVQSRKTRPDLSVGSIIDLRRHTHPDLNETFGLFLGFTDVVCRPHDLGDWRRLVRSIAAQNRVHRQNGIAQASMTWMLAAQAFNPLVPDRNLYRFYRKELPMAGGLSNVRLNDTWAARYHPDPLREYLRVSPTGPLVPLVFSTTTLGERLFIAMTHRQALLDAPSAGAMIESFIARLRSITGITAPVAAMARVTVENAERPAPGRLPGQKDRHPAKCNRPTDDFVNHARRAHPAS
jgi:hypothetical protein